MAALSLSLAGVALSRLRTSPDRARSKPLNVSGSFVSAAVPRASAFASAREAGDGGMHAQVAPVALLTRVSEGVRIVRRNDVIAAQAGALLQQGDRVIVPQQGSAQAVFQEQDGQALLGPTELASLAPGAIVINTARASLVDETAMLAALDAGQVGVYATDVFDAEPPAMSALILHPQVLTTSHIGGFTEESVTRATATAVENLLRVLGPANSLTPREVALA